MHDFDAPHRRVGEVFVGETIPTVATFEPAQRELDLSFVAPDPHRVSGLGASTRSVITATNVLSNREERLAPRNAQLGGYRIELTRVAGEGTVRGPLMRFASTG